MNRTQGIFLFASIVVGLALVVTLRQPASSSFPAPPPTSPPTSPHKAHASDQAVDLALLLSHPYVASDRATDVFLQVNLQGKTGSKTTRLPLDVGVVIDRSGSMAGAKLAHAKAAARRLVEQLHDGDHVAIVTYGSDVTLLVPSRRVDDRSRREILATIETISDRGGTFLSGGLRAAATALRRTFNGQHVTRIILISDGQANEGLTTKPGLAKLAQETARGGIAVTTMGVGLDFSEDVMTAIAEHGNGHYYFIKDATSLAGIFDRELSKMMATVARRPRLQITLDPGVELVSLYGYDYRRHGQNLELALPDLFAKQHRRVTLKIRIPKGLATERPIAHATLFYADAKDHRQALASRISAVATPDQALVDRSLQGKVLARGQEVELARSTTKALNDYRSGKVAAAQALLRRRLQSAMSANKRLRSKALRDVIGGTRQILESTRAAPTSSAGRAAVKAGKARAYKLAK